MRICHFVICVIFCIIALSGCTTNFHAVNDELFASPEILNANMKALKARASYDAHIKKPDVFNIIGVTEKKCGQMDGDRVRDFVFGKNMQIQVREDRLDEMVNRQKEYTGCSFSYSSVTEKSGPSFDWSGIVGIKTEKTGPSMEVIVIFHKDEFYDAGAFGQSNVNDVRTEWIWSLMGRLIESGAQRGVSSFY